MERDPTGPPEFLTLFTEEERQAVYRELKEIEKFACDSAVPIAVSPPPAAAIHPYPRTATGFLIRVRETIYLGTAAHVWEWFSDGVEEGLRFQAGRLLITDRQRGVHSVKGRDVVFIPLSQAETDGFKGVANIAEVSQWPADVPDEGLLSC